jgi:hypothetical protein
MCFDVLCARNLRYGVAGHAFHQDCIDTWFDAATTCPNCVCEPETPTGELPFDLGSMGAACAKCASARLRSGSGDSEFELPFPRAGSVESLHTNDGGGAASGGGGGSGGIGSSRELGTTPKTVGAAMAEVKFQNSQRSLTATAAAALVLSFPLL